MDFRAGNSDRLPFSKGRPDDLSRIADSGNAAAALAEAIESAVDTGRSGGLVAVGDVAGKGVAASLLMTHLSTIFRSLLSLDLPCTEVTSRANRLFCECTLATHIRLLWLVAKNGSFVATTDPAGFRGKAAHRLGGPRGFAVN